MCSQVEFQTDAMGKTEDWGAPPHTPASKEGNWRTGDLALTDGAWSPLFAFTAAAYAVTGTAGIKNLLLL